MYRQIASLWTPHVRSQEFVDGTALALPLWTLFVFLGWTCSTTYMYLTTIAPLTTIEKCSQYWTKGHYSYYSSYRTSARHCTTRRHVLLRHIICDGRAQVIHRPGLPASLSWRRRTSDAGHEVAALNLPSLPSLSAGARLQSNDDARRLVSGARAASLLLRTPLQQHW